jgi:hypothetical protein
MRMITNPLGIYLKRHSFGPLHIKPTGAISQSLDIPE